MAGALWAARHLRRSNVFYDEWGMIERALHAGAWEGAFASFSGHRWMLQCRLSRIHAGTAKTKFCHEVPRYVSSPAGCPPAADSQPLGFVSPPVTTGLVRELLDRGLLSPPAAGPIDPAIAARMCR